MNRQHGMTLVELVIAIVIVGIAAAALYSAMAAITARSADPMLRQQSLMIAEGYLEEILLKDYPPNPRCGTTGASQGDKRALFSHICEYDGLSYPGEKPLAPRNLLSSELIPGLEAYQVRIQASESELGGAATSVSAIRIDVTVRDPQGQTLTLTGWRTDY